MTHGPTSPRPRWFTDTKDGHSEWYVERFRTMAAEGKDLAGEARLIDAMVSPGSRVLDAGCGPGRVGSELHARGHTIVGADADPVLIAAAAEDHPGPRWVVADLSDLDLDEQPFDIAVMAGNVMVFLAPHSEQQVLSRLRAHMRPGGRIVVGFATDRDYELVAFDADVVAAGLTLEQRFATWDLVPFSDESDFAVSVLRVPE
ncbi:bifunctional 2-polyprenyl-6-hydroxyphenol methylase/3-demethylubiquinol 3-O-methyltransferase UbiG [Aeromicrobium sp.]|uniref:class I SAM-dependent methyltransferase n=1 Tax=Aeromicrobium sp. TaxID=1871063 RepID=UPI0019902105|nr:class I SAM-dependent methyltransferase [Aeromicrobium sp.]MBC7631820.1 class I SAM-dependent methyltransferase [Aeromicrobium sp.]